MPSLKRQRQEMDDEGATRKRVRTLSLDDDATSIAEPITQPIAMDSNQPSQDVQALQSLRGDFDDLRQLITCKICERLLYEPYVISCGHTYCYSCLCTWFATTKKKTCPNCREHVKSPPAPSYVIKEMTNVFMRRHDLLPDGETIEQHEQWRFEEAEIVRKDKNDADPRTGGLFKGFFRSRREKLYPNHDPVDHVDRCPHCNWEIEDGMCNHCGIIMDRYSDSDSESDSDLSNSLDGEQIPDDFEDDDIDADPAFGEFDNDFDRRNWQDWSFDEGDEMMMDPRVRQEVLMRIVRPRGGMPFERGFIDEHAEDDEELHDEDEDEEDDDEGTGSLHDFIDDRDANDITAYTISSQPGYSPRRNRHVIVSSDDAQQESASSSRSGSESDGLRHNPRYGGPAPVHISDDDDDDEDDDVPRAMPRRQGRRAVPSHRVIESGDDDDSDDEPRVIASRPRQPTVRRQPRTIRISDSDDDDDDDDDESSATEEGTDEPSYHTRLQPFRAQRRQTSEDLDSEESESEGPDQFNQVRRQSSSQSSRSEDENDEENQHDDEEMGDGLIEGFSPMQPEDDEEDDDDEQAGKGHYDVYDELSDEGEEGW